MHQKSSVVQLVVEEICPSGHVK